MRVRSGWHEGDPAPTMIAIAPLATPFDLLPSMNALQVSYLASYEWLAILWRLLTGGSERRNSSTIPQSDLTERHFVRSPEPPDPFPAR
jgi:hypothetical protein